MSKYIDLELALNELLRLYEEDVDRFGVEIDETFDYQRAREALVNLPTIEVSEDCVSRQAVEEMIKAEMPERGMWEIEGDKEKETVCEVCVDLMQKLSELPPVTPSRAEGEWIDKHATHYECSECGEWVSKESAGGYCGFCGAKMKGVNI